jgi:WD40 repeat protein
MTVLMNENIAKLALSSIQNKISLLNRITSKFISLLLLSLIGYEEVFKSTKKTKSLRVGMREISSLISLGNGNIVSGSNDKAVLTVWDLNSYEFTKTLTDTTVIGFNDNILYTFSHDRIELWGMDDFKYLKTIKLEESFLVYSSLVLANGNIAVVPKNDSVFSSKMILVLDSSNNFKPMKTITEHQSVVCSLVNLSDNKFASGCTSIRIWCHINYTCLKTLTGHGGYVEAMLYSANNNILLSGSFDKTIKIWECNNYLCIKTIFAHDSGVKCFAKLANGYFASGSADKKIKIWDLTNYQCIATLEGHGIGVITLLSLKDKRLVSGSFYGEIIIWDCGFTG